MELWICLWCCAGALVDAKGDNARLGGQYGKKCKTGDVIEMYLDFDKCTLSFNINGEDMGCSHQNIEKTEYKIAICTSCNAEIKLFWSFEIFAIC